MRSRVFLFSFVIVATSLALPFAAHAAAIPFFGPIIPEAQDVCPGSWAMLITVVNNVIRLALTLGIVLLVPIRIAFAGFAIVTNPANPGVRSKQGKAILNTVIGIVVAMAAWLIVGAVMTVLYNPSARSGTTVLGTWSSIINGTGDLCLQQAGANPKDELSQADVTGVSAGDTPVSGGAGVLCSSSNNACSPSALQAIGLNSTQANIMSCIAISESSGNSATPPYNTTHPGSNSTACGTFQITQTTWNKAASGACSNFSSCIDASCNMKVMQTLVSQSGYTSWTCPNCNSKAAPCIQKYGGQ